MTPRPLTDGETRLLLKLLEALPNGMEYVEQLKSAKVSQWAGDSSLRFEFERNVKPVGNETGIPVEGQFCDADGISIHVLLHVKNGEIRILEIYKEDGTSIIHMPPTTDLQLFRP